MLSGGSLLFALHIPNGPGTLLLDERTLGFTKNLCVWDKPFGNLSVAWKCGAPGLVACVASCSLGHEFPAVSHTCTYSLQH